VGRLKPDPAQPAQQVIELIGLPGDSDRAGYQRLYLTARLDYYAEFQTQDVVYSETVAADASPIAGQEATRAGIQRDATNSYTWVRSTRPVDEFDLDVRLGAAVGTAVPALAPQTAPINTCPTCTCNTNCRQATCANTCPDTCATCNTNCGQATCANTCPNTCNTCNTNCGQATCANTCPNATCANTCACVLPTRVCTHAPPC
jgi:hypothetical protein